MGSLLCGDLEEELAEILDTELDERLPTGAHSLMDWRASGKRERSATVQGNVYWRSGVSCRLSKTTLAPGCRLQVVWRAI